MILIYKGKELGWNDFGNYRLVTFTGYKIFTRALACSSSRKEYHRADLQPTHSMWKIYPAPARPLPCLHRLQEGLWQGLACSFFRQPWRSTTSAQTLSKSSKTSITRATSAVLFSRSIRYWFRTTVGVRQGCPLSPTLFNIFLEKIMTDTLEDHEGTASIGGRTITNLCFADDIGGLAGEEEELANLAECLDKASTACGMEISAKKTKLMTNNSSSIDRRSK